MSWTFSQLKAALLALTPTPADDTAAAAALNAQTAVMPPQDIPTSDARQVLLLSGEWYGITQLSTKPTSGATPPTASDQAIVAAFLCVETMNNTATLHIADPAKWAIVQNMLGGLQQAGVISAASVANLTALRTPTAPVWQPAVTVGDIQTARVQP